MPPPAVRWQIRKDMLWGSYGNYSPNSVYLPFPATLLRASKELRGNKANTEPFPGLPTALSPSISLNVFLLLCLLDPRAPTGLSKGFQEMVGTSKAGLFVCLPLGRFSETYVKSTHCHHETRSIDVSRTPVSQPLEHCRPEKGGVRREVCVVRPRGGLPVSPLPAAAAQ